MTTLIPAAAAETIRQAATAIREIANDVTTVGHGWTTHPPDDGSRDWTVGAGTVLVAQTPDYGQQYLPDHIASWTPPNALLVAGLLDSIAAEIEEALEDHDGRIPGSTPRAWHDATRLAIAYLDKDPRK